VSGSGPSSPTVRATLVVKQIQEQRVKQAESEGRTLSPAQASAPLTPAEMEQAQESVKRATKRAAPMSAPEIQQRLDAMQQHQ